jgi:uncharacterized phage protein (TIGR02218 family)
MKSATSELLSLLNSYDEFIMADLLTITLVGGTSVYYTNSDVNIVWNGHTFTPFVMERSKVRIVRGLEVDSLELTMSPKIYPISTDSEEDEDTLLGISWLKAVRLGALDGATIKLERAFSSSTPNDDIISVLNPVGVVILFTGNVAEPVKLTQEAEITVKSDLEIFNRQLPRNLYQPGCQYTLFDIGCTLNKANWATVSQVVAGSTRKVVVCDNTGATGYYDLGAIEFTSGELDGTRKTIKSQTPGQLTLNSSLLTIPSVGDGLILWPGCDKRQITCAEKFSNLAYTAGNTVSHFRGMPYVPKPENAY